MNRPVELDALTAARAQFPALERWTYMDVAGRGVLFKRRHRLHGPIALYGGRIDPGKGCEELIEYFSSYVQDGGDASLVLMGVKLMPLPEEPFIHFAGRLPDQERLQALEAATVVVVPSPYESLSLLALEAFAVGTPVLANARCDVLKGQCIRSNAQAYSIACVYGISRLPHRHCIDNCTAAGELAAIWWAISSAVSSSLSAGTTSSTRPS